MHSHYDGTDFYQKKLFPKCFGSLLIQFSIAEINENYYV